MRITEKEKARNRALIVEKAGQLFREKGLHEVGIADLMREAGFTHGGFYNHFASKEDLTAEVCATAIARGNASFAAELAGPDADEMWRRYVDSYLSPEHRDEPSRGCTVAALLGEAAHEPANVQASIVEGTEEFLGILGRYFSRRYRLDDAGGRGRAIAVWAQMLGAFSLSRAVVRSDRRLADEILATCREKLAR